MVNISNAPPSAWRSAPPIFGIAEDVQLSPHWIAVGAGGFLVLIFVKQLDSVPPSPLNPHSPDDALISATLTAIQI